MKFTMPYAFKARFTGLGNEFFPWIKAFITSRELGVRLLVPAWGLHTRGYRPYFGTSRYDWVTRAMVYYGLPRYEFTEGDYNATGAVDFDEAIRIHAEREGLLRKKAYVLVHDGLWPGFHPLRRARPYVMAQLYRTNYVVENLYHFYGQVPPEAIVIAVNIRLGDFFPPVSPDQYRGIWNTRLPLEWYANVCRRLKQALGKRALFYLVSDGTPQELRDFIDEFQPVMTFGRPKVCSDLLCMAQADALVCSISTYSMWAAFLGKGLYFWYGPHLQEREGRLTMWGEEPRVHDPACDDSARDPLPRGVPVGPEGEIPFWAVEYLEMRGRLASPKRDLVMSGDVRP